MKKQVQNTGERDWFGDDILMIQNEVWSFLETLLSQYNNACIITGCVVTPHVGGGGNFDISSGIILVQDSSNVWQYCRFAGATNVSLPQYLVAAETDTNALYHDSVSKPIISSLDCVLQSSLPSSGGYLQLTSAGAPTWLDIIQSSQKRFVTDAQIAAWNAAASIVPGLVIMQAMAAVPSGWLACDGSAISRTVYANLFAAIGVIYGAGDGSTTFNIPNLNNGDTITGVSGSRALGSHEDASVGAANVEGKLVRLATADGLGSGNDVIVLDITSESHVTTYGSPEVNNAAGTGTNKVNNTALKFIIKY